MHLNILTVFASSSIVDIDGTVFIQLGIFLAMLVFFQFTLFRPVLRLIEARREATESVRDQAVKLKEQAVAMSTEVEAKIRAIRHAATEERDHIVDQARTRDREIVAATRGESAALLAEARTEMVQMAASVRAELMADLPKMSELLAARVLGRHL